MFYILNNFNKWIENLIYIVFCIVLVGICGLNIYSKKELLSLPTDFGGLTYSTNWNLGPVKLST